MTLPAARLPGTTIVARKGTWLIRRLLLLVLICLLPTVTLGIAVQLDQRAERKVQLEELVLRQAELLNGDISSIAEGAHGLLTTATELPAVRRSDESCQKLLETINARLPAYAFLAVVGRSGQLVCSSRETFDGGIAGRPAWVRDALAADGFAVGRYATQSGAADTGFVPFFLPIDGRPERDGVIVAALSLPWLTEHLRDFRLVDTHLPHGSVLTVADPDGVILARLPQAETFVGQRFPPAVMQIISGADPGIARLKSIDGRDRIIGFVPASRSGSGLIVSAGFSEPDLMEDINRATRRGALLLAATTLAAIALTLAVGRRFIGFPTAKLVEAAARWRTGDLRARAVVPDPGSEFGQIAGACNAMAAELEKRQAELRQQAQLLEARVVERTAKLSESNNRLQVEIVKHRETEAALVQAQKLQAVGQLAGGVAHDFNNLLATILGSLELLGRDLPADQGRQLGMIRRASSAVHRGAQLTGRLLAFTRRRRLIVRPTDVNKLIGDLGALLATSMLGSHVRAEMKLQPGVWPAMVEPSQVEAAILNLVLNARDAMPGGGAITIATANEERGPPLSPNDPPSGDYVRITVSDTGTGMTDEVVRHAFDPFFTTKGAAGSGLGLSQVYATTREAGGGIHIVTAPEAGTSVSLLLPRALAEASPPSHHPARGPSRPWNALLVDDDEAVRHVTAEMLKDLDCRVREAKDGAEALALLADANGLADRPEPPDLLVVDYAMPGLSGLALAARARAVGFVGPVLLVTGYAELDEPDLPNETAPDAILVKPFTMEMLQQVLGRLQRASGDNSAAA